MLRLRRTFSRHVTLLIATLSLSILLPLGISTGVTTAPLAAAAPEATEPGDDEADQILYLPVIQLESKQMLLGEESRVGYATGPDRTLIRWYWNNPSQPKAFHVYRTIGDSAETLVAEVTPTTESAAAMALLNGTEPAWPNLADEVLGQFANAGVSDINSLHNFLADDRFVAQQLANERYPVALLIGWGYLDTDIQPGEKNIYRVVVIAHDDVAIELGAVTVLPGELTPLAAPQALTAVNMQPGSSQHAVARAGEWGAVQRNRRFHHTVYLRWAQNAEVESPTGAWVTGYDLYRQAGDGTFQHISPPQAIRPMPATQPISETTLITQPVAYEEIDFYFADEPPTPGKYVYRVAPRDLLGQIRQWPTDASQFSAPAIAHAHDFLPPSAPHNLVATPLEDNGGVRLTWAMTPTADLDGFRIERTLMLNSPIALNVCASDAECWQEAATLPVGATEWVDSDATLESVRWYRVQAVDADGNRSYFAGPVQGVLHDITPPAPPIVGLEACGKIGLFCIWGGSNEPDVTRLRIACRFDDSGEEMLLDEIDGNQLGNYSIPENVYTPPIDLGELDCSVYAVDAHGNISGPAAIQLPWLDSPLPAQVGQPVITEIETLGSPDNFSARVHWQITNSPLIEAFRIERTDILGATPPFSEIVAADKRQFDDETVIPGHTYMYTITADLTFNNGEKESLPKLYRATLDGVRDLRKFEMSLSGTSQNIRVAWNLCDVALQEPPYYLAIYRSIHASQDYQQLTPIMPFSACNDLYIDTSADHIDYWYMVVHFDARTGEAIAYTDPGRLAPLPPVAAAPPIYVPQPSMHSRLHNYVYQSSNSVAILPCSATAPGELVSGDLLTFGGGFTVKIVSAAALHGTNITGSGLLHLTVNGEAMEIPVAFEDVTVGDERLHVCHVGSFSIVSFGEILGHALEVTPPDAMPYTIIGLTLQPWFKLGDNRAWGELALDLPQTTRSIDHNGITAGNLRLAGEALRIDNTLAFDFTVDADDLVGHGCDSPLYAWALETLPVHVIPMLPLSVTEEGISSDGGCMRYHERYTEANGLRPTPTDHNAGDANDGFLRGNYTSSGVGINALGMQASFSTSDDLGWITSYPFGFNVNVTGDLQITLAQSRIASGAMGAGGIQLGYHQTVNDAGVQPFTATFAQATIDAGGAIFANVQTANDIAWLVPGGFRVDAGAWDWYAGAVTTPGLPATVQTGIAQAVMFAPRPGATTPIDTAAGIALPGEMEPGLNRRVNPGTLHWGNCCGPEIDFAAALDLYVRHGGVSGRFIAQLAGPINVSIYGYDGRLDHFEFAFLDNGVWDSNVTGEIDLPFPSNITLRLVDMWLADDGCGACLGGGIVPPDQRQHTLEYWQVQVELHTVEFHPDAPGPEPVCEKLLVANGNITVPHLAIPGMSAPTRLEMEMVFLTNGMAVPHILAYTRGDYLFDNFPYLLEGMRLSEVDENANWLASATLLDPPSVNWNEVGFVALDGAFVTRYFGPLQGQDDDPEKRPEVRFLVATGGFVGTSEKLAAKKSWVDLQIAEIGLHFDMTAFNMQNELHFVATRNYDFLPDNYLALLPDDLADELHILHLDTSVILEPAGVDIFAGLSSGVAALHALAEATGGTLPAPPVADAWSTKLGIDEADKYYSLLSDTWSSYGDDDFRGTTNALDTYSSQEGQALPDDPNFGGGTDGFLERVGVNFKRMRGDIQFINADEPGRIQLDHFMLSTQVDIVRAGEAGSLLYMEHMSFEINRHGDYILEAIGVSSNLYASDLTLDATLRINVEPDTRQFEGGLTLYAFNVSTVRVVEGSAVLGVGQQANFVGASFTGYASSGPSGGSVTMGGSFVVGTIDPASPVLLNHFSEVVDKLSEVESSPNDPTPPATLNGLYLRIYGDTTLWNDGGILQLNAGAEIAVWLWVDNISEHTDIPDEITEATQLLNFVTFGGKYRFFVHGKILSVISARGDVSLIYWDRPGDIQPASDGFVDAILNDVINRKRSLIGIAWVAGGVGLCDAGTWTSWESRWWGDSWCWNAGAYLEVEANLTGLNPAGLDIDADWETDYEGS